ncbi:N-acetylmuramate alpha-1-phosphate uridylyltransferase MurU [Methylococcus capsulatus]|uniref:N-acetylmuramate alpha-1-phosphate uridylyltransferase n=1 Tax=Methylococcus capsulatus TaxID=414 RepID=A0AA35XZA4_METCP|nr:nucleotidyltransferase family protein [Methylococcus capsulatus]CAI8756254.1 N-acetylmuramate alpha-1-phosphate uridylyltransferase [Methylococcus capsulatus]
MKAMILAAGRGERLRPLTDHTPKPLLPAGGRPLIEHTLEALVQAGFKDIVVNLAHLGWQIRERLGDGARFGARIRYSDEGDHALETAGGIRQALALLGPAPFIVVNGDIGTDYDFARLRRAPSGDAHLVLVPNPPHHPQGDFVLTEEQVTPPGDGARTWTFAGIGLYRTELFASLPPGRAPLAPLLRQAMDAGRVSGELHPGFWLDIGTVERLKSYDRWLHERRPARSVLAV